MKQAFLTGYTGKPTRSPAQLLQLAINLEAVVIDSRFNPQSRVAHWSKVALQDALGKRYDWLRDFGNLAYKENRIELLNPFAGMYYLERRLSDKFIIICACANGETCHRKQVGEYLAANGWEVREVTAQEWRDTKL